MGDSSEQTPSRIHRTDKLGEHSDTSPRFDHTEARAEATLVFPELAKKQGWGFYPIQRQRDLHRSRPEER